MTTFNINQLDKQILLNAFNEANQTSLSINDVVFSNPTARTTSRYDIEKSKLILTNTEITISASTSSGLYAGSIVFYYNRMNLADIFNQGNKPVSVAGHQNLYGLLNNINAAYGVNLTSSDVVDSSVILQNDGVVVSIASRPTSLLYCGSCDVRLSTYPTPPDGIALSYVLFNTNVISDMVKCYTGVIELTNYSFLFNASTIATCNVSEIYKSRSGIIVNGHFVLTYTDIANGYSITIDAHSLQIDYRGAITGYNNSYAFLQVPNKRVAVYNSDSDYAAYAINSTTGGNTVSKFDEFGQVTNYTFTEPVSYLQVDSSGNLYTCSSELNDGVRKYYQINRYLSSGDTDGSFTPLTIKSHNPTLLPPPVVEIVPIESEGAWVLLKPLYGVSRVTSSIMINDSLLAPVETTEMSYNPILKIQSDGSLDNLMFSNRLDNYLDSVIYQASNSTLDRFSKNIVGDSDYVFWISNYKSPITGRITQRPIVFDKHGNVKPSHVSPKDEIYFNWINFIGCLISPAKPRAGFVAGNVIVDSLPRGIIGVYNTQTSELAHIYTDVQISSFTVV